MKNYEKKGSKSGLLKTFGPILGFTVKTVLGTCDPRRSRLPFRTKNPENAWTSCTYVETKKCLLLLFKILCLSQNKIESKSTKKLCKQKICKALLIMTGLKKF